MPHNAYKIKGNKTLAESDVLYSKKKLSSNCDFRLKFCKSEFYFETRFILPWMSPFSIGIVCVYVCLYA